MLLTLVAIAEVGPGQATATTSEWNVTIDYAKITRAGEPVPLELTVTNRRAAIDQPIAVQACGSWFDAMDFQNWYPNPSAETRSGDTLIYEFDAPNEREFTVAFDGRSSPGRFGERLNCTFTVSVGAAEIFSEPITTWRLP